MRPRSSSLVAGVGCLLAGSCSGQALAPASAPDPVFTDGSRLRAIWEQAPGAPKRQTGWYDTTLETQCAFAYPSAPAATRRFDEAQYCLPFPIDAFRAYGPRQFLDAACTQEIIEPGDGTRLVMLEPERSDDCGHPSRLFTLGPRVAGAAAYRSDGKGACTPDEQPVGAGAYALGEEVPLSALVSATIQAPVGDGPRISPAVLYADDGASQPVAAWDRDRGQPVSIPSWGHGTDTAFLWEPVSTASRQRDPTTTYHADANCAGWVASSLTCGDDPVRSISEIVGTTCAFAPKLLHYEVGASIDASAIRALGSSTGEACVTLSPPRLPADAVLRFFAPGAPIPDSAFAAAGVSDQGTDRVRLRVPTSADGSVDIGAGIHVDSLLQQTCAALPAADGSLRCLPSIVPDGVDFFADPECTVPAVLFDLLAADCPPPAPTAVSISQTGSSYRVYEVAGPPARALYWRTGLACTDAGTFLDSSAAYALGPEMPPAAFVPMATSDHYPGR